MTAREYFRQLRLAKCQEDIDRVVKESCRDTDITAITFSKILLAVKRRRAELPERIGGDG